MGASKIFFPLKDKAKLYEAFENANIQLVINLCRSRAPNTGDENYVARRNAVDFGIALATNPNLAKLWVETLKHKKDSQSMGAYQEGSIPKDIQSWREWVPNTY